MTIDSRWTALDDKSHPGRPVGPEIDRASATDLMEFITDTAGHPNHVAAVLMLDATPSMGELREALDARIRAVPRLRRRLVRSPFGCGRPIWVDDPSFDITNHVNLFDCPYLTDKASMLHLAAELAGGRMWEERPLWHSYLITNLEGGRSALLVVFHHVLADGIGGLAALTKLVDGAPPAPVVDFPQPRPGRRALFADAMRTRAYAGRHLLTGVRRIRAAATELGLSKRIRAPRTSLNQKVGRHRNLAVARVELAAVRATGHKYDATVNDVMLTAIGGALGKLLRHRGETVDRLVISIPVSARREADATELGNQVGVIPVAVPVSGDPFDRLVAIAEITGRRKAAARGASAVLLAPMFRTLGSLGLLRWYVNHQHRVNTFVTNVRGPQERLSLLGMPVREVIPIGHTTGNVSVAFAVLGYAGRLIVTVTADREIFVEAEDLAVLSAELQAQLDILTMPDFSEPES